jgi:hypothetical protein
MINMRQNEGKESVDTGFWAIRERRLLDHDVGGVYGNVALISKRSFDKTKPFYLPNSLLKLYWEL